MAAAAAPLSGVLVVSVEQAVAAPFAARQLADLGARVIKVERPEGDFARSYDRAVHGQSSYFVWLNRNKESVCLDLRSEGGRAYLTALLERADVFIQNLAPGAAARLGLGAPALRERHPRLITCSISGYGEGGPMQDRKAYDALLQAQTGLITITGTPGQPAKVGISIADIAAGMYAFTGVLAALYRRERTGEGATLQVSLLDALGEWMQQPALWRAYGGVEPAPSGAHHASIAPYGPYQAGDGAAVFLAIQNEREWLRFCTVVLDDPTIATDPRFAHNPDRVAHRVELDDELGRAIAGLTRGEFLRRLDAAGTAYSDLSTVQDFLENDQLEARGRWQDIGTPEGPARVLRSPIQAAEFIEMTGDVPALGQHTEAIAREFAIPNPKGA